MNLMSFVAAEIFEERKRDDLKSLDPRHPRHNALIGLKYGNLDYAMKELPKHQLQLRNTALKELRHSQSVSANVARAIKTNQLLTEIAIKRGVPRNSFPHYNFLESVSLPSSVRVLPSVRSDIRTLGEESFIETFQRQLRKETVQKKGLAPK